MYDVDLISISCVAWYFFSICIVIKVLCKVCNVQTMDQDTDHGLNYHLICVLHSSIIIIFIVFLLFFITPKFLPRYTFFYYSNIVWKINKINVLMKFEFMICRNYKKYIIFINNLSRKIFFLH